MDEEKKDCEKARKELPGDAVLRILQSVGAISPAQTETTRHDMSAIRYSVIGREIGAHIGSRLVALRFSGMWVPSFESRCAGLTEVCPLITNQIASDFGRFKN